MQLKKLLGQWDWIEFRITTPLLEVECRPRDGDEEAAWEASSWHCSPSRR